MTIQSVLNLRSTYLYAEGASLVRVDSDALWKRLMGGAPAGPEAEQVARGLGWLVGLHHYGESWSLWEMHPEGDEIVHVVAGAFEFVLDTAGSEKSVQVQAGLTLVVPKGVWHRAIVHTPGDAVHITFGKGTQHRPVDEGE
jgi:mannose-6-phosphate isomerase-like protein (cupin superfamily)